jgi:hypothetical protein
MGRFPPIALGETGFRLALSSALLRGGRAPDGSALGIIARGVICPALAIQMPLDPPNTSVVAHHRVGKLPQFRLRPRRWPWGRGRCRAPPSRFPRDVAIVLSADRPGAGAGLHRPVGRTSGGGLSRRAVRAAHTSCAGTIRRRSQDPDPHQAPSEAGASPKRVPRRAIADRRRWTSLRDSQSDEGPVSP